MLLFKILVDETQTPQSQDFKSTFKQILVCIFLSVRVNLKETFQCETPCMLGRIGILDWISTRNIIDLRCLLPHGFGVNFWEENKLVVAISFHAFLREPNFKILDRSIYYERLLRPTIMGCIFENTGIEPSLQYINIRPLLSD